MKETKAGPQQVVFGGIIGALFLMLGARVFAQETATRPVYLDPSRTATQSTVFDQTESRFSRKQWDLTEAEWTRYLRLLRGPRGSISPANVSPIEVLGVHARSDEERMQYARKWARILHEDAERVIRFQVAYNAAVAELYPNEDIIDMSRLGPAFSPVEEKAVQTGDRVLLFIRLHNCPECKPLYTRVRRAAFEANAQLDIYFTDTEQGKDDRAVLEWIANNRFDENRIKRSQVTFNHEDGALKRAGGELAKAPAAFRIRHALIDRLEIGMPGL